MEFFRTILALLMIFRFSSSDPFCTPQEIQNVANHIMTVAEISDGCWTDYVTKDGADVHILKLRFNRENYYPILKLTAAVPVIVIITNLDAHIKHISIESSSDIKFYVTNGTQLMDAGPQVYSAPAVQDNELISWATEQFGGVSSFNTLYEPTSINFTGIKESSLGSKCQLMMGLEPHVRKSLTVQYSSRAIKFCLGKTQDELHIINIPDDSQIRNVTLDVIRANVKLVLRGPAGTVWKVSGESCQLASNNVLRLFEHSLPGNVNLSANDSKLQKEAVGIFKNSSLTSYTRITMDSAAITIRLEKRKDAEVTVKPTVKPTVTPTVNTSNKLNMWIQLFMSSDYMVQLKSSSKVQTNTRIYAQVWSVVYGGWTPIIKVASCSVHSRDIQSLDRKISVTPEPCLACHNNTRFSFTLDTLQDQPSNHWELQCFIKLCTRGLLSDQSCAMPELVKTNIHVTPSCVPPLISDRCFEFSLQSVLGIAFGGFLIGVLLIGTLWFIKIRTGYPISLGFGSTGTFFSGCPCSLTKHHVVSTNPSPSENSSANGSMSSTQSTPTSSMA